MRRRLTSLLALTLAALLVLTSCSFFSTGDDTGDTTTGGPTAPEAYVSLDINPDVSLVVGSDGKVTSVMAENEDGRVLLYEEGGIIGAELEAAIERITSLAVELGYLDEGNRVVGTTATLSDGSSPDALLSRIHTKITATAQAAGLSVTTDAAGAFSLLRELEALKAKFPNNEKVASLTVSRYQLVLSATESGELSVEAAVEMDDRALIAAVKEASAVIEGYATEAYRKAKADAAAILDEATGMVLDGVYNTYYMQNLTKHLTTAHYGGVYQMYTSTARGLRAVADALAYVESLKKYEIPANDAAAILEALGMEASEIDALKGEDGRITVESVEAYADVLFKNTPASATLEAQKTALRTALAAAEASLAPYVEAAAEVYKAQVRAVITAGEAQVDAMQLMAQNPLLAEEIAAVTAEFNTLKGEVEAILDGDVPTEAVMRAKADALTAKSEAMLERILADLTDEEEAAVEAMKASLEGQLATARATFEAAITEAETAARTAIAAAKAERRAAAEA